jgi:hypothetical protein
MSEETDKLAMPSYQQNHHTAIYLCIVYEARPVYDNPESSQIAFRQRKRGCSSQPQVIVKRTVNAKMLQ